MNNKICKKNSLYAVRKQKPHPPSTLQKEISQHKSQMKAGAFHLNMHPTDYFDHNPYRTDKPLPPVRKSAGDITKKDGLPPFKPSNPGKLVSPEL